METMEISLWKSTIQIRNILIWDSAVIFDTIKYLIWLTTWSLEVSCILHFYDSVVTSHSMNITILNGENIWYEMRGEQ